MSQANYHKTKWFSENFLAIEIKKTEVKMYKPIYIGLSILDISELAMYEYWYEYVKPNYRDKANIRYMDTDSFMIHVKSEDIYADLADVQKRFDTLNYEADSPLPIGKKTRKQQGWQKMNWVGK